MGRRLTTEVSGLQNDNAENAEVKGYNLSQKHKAFHSNLNRKWDTSLGKVVSNSVVAVQIQQVGPRR